MTIKTTKEKIEFEAYITRVGKRFRNRPQQITMKDIRGKDVIDLIHGIVNHSVILRDHVNDCGFLKIGDKVKISIETIE